MVRDVFVCNPQPVQTAHLSGQFFCHLCVEFKGRGRPRVSLHAVLLARLALTHTCLLSRQLSSRCHCCCLSLSNLPICSFFPLARRAPPTQGGLMLPPPGAGGAGPAKGCLSHFVVGQFIFSASFHAPICFLLGWLCALCCGSKSLAPYLMCFAYCAVKSIVSLPVSCCLLLGSDCFA